MDFMSLRAATLCSSSWRINATRRAAYQHRSYADSSKTPFQIDPLLADLLVANEKPRGIGRPPRPKQNQHWVSVRNPQSASLLAEAFVPDGSRDKVVIEAFPGPGQLTRALLGLPEGRIKRLIVMEDYGPYFEYLKSLETLDSRVKVISIPGYDWDSYQTIQDMGLMNDVSKLPWDAGVHPQLQFISHLPSNVTGEQLIAQLFRSIPEQQWLFQYGRVPLSFILSEYVWKRVSATTNDSTMRCKLSVIAEAVAQSSEALPFSLLQPFQDHFHPVPSTFSMSSEKRHNNRRVGNPFQAINITPLEFQAIKKGKLDKWDYCLRRLFVRKATALKGAFRMHNCLSGPTLYLLLPRSLAPGAQTLIKKIADPNLPEAERVDIKKIVRKMSINDWSLLLKAFDEWPFAPEDLSITDSFAMKEIR
ncbi:hypothetical protein BD779DRAFT_1505842 [Infundibulicybe gibba]|nr:hypothetical protein BD779DRAFT_1505842 [Infundibulicybe gibba]